MVTRIDTSEAPGASAHSLKSSYREALLEHLLVGELMRVVWLGGSAPLEVSKPQVDAAGYDLILQCDGVLRHVQLKSSDRSARTRSVNVQTALMDRHGGCVIWVLFDEKTLELGPFLWLGSAPGHPAPAIGGLRVAKHAKGDATGHKAERPGLRVVPRSRFETIADVDGLLERLFGH